MFYILWEWMIKGIFVSETGKKMNKVIITINRESGSGGREIALRLGEMLNMNVYDKAILEAVTEKYHLTKHEIERIKAKKINFWDDFCQFYRQFDAVGDNYQPESNKVTSRELYYAESQIMRNLASQGSCIIVGRCGFSVFKDNPDAVKVFIHADRDVRIRRVVETKKLDEKGAAEYIDEVDKARENFTKYFAGSSRYDTRNYDVSLNVSHFSIEEVVSFLAENIRRRMEKKQ